MKYLRSSSERGYFDHGWLKTFHSFSFGEYHDRRFMGFRSLRVINEDMVSPGEGFPSHGHQNMEIITYILDGALEHKDSMGSGSVIRPGDVQYMSAASGVMHSEFNPSSEVPVHLLQIWILPDKNGGDPLYRESHFTKENRINRLCPVASPDGRDGSIAIRQNSTLYASLLENGKTINFQGKKDRYYWFQCARGSIRVEDTILNAGDGLALSEVEHIEIMGLSDAEFILFDLS